MRLLHLQGGFSERVASLRDVAQPVARCFKILSKDCLLKFSRLCDLMSVAAGRKDVSKNISGVTLAAQETSSGASQVLEAAQELLKQSEALQRSVESFLVSVRAG